MRAVRHGGIGAFRSDLRERATDRDRDKVTLTANAEGIFLTNKFITPNPNQNNPESLNDPN